ncbi:MAG: glutamate-5-semialdehyde dehydrogenase [Clostridiales bacterium]|nr:glutamate-5-semialdehyde dehydrogenase [Clostridiales bacterium]
MSTQEILKKSKEAWTNTGLIDTDTKNRVLRAMAEQLRQDTDKILEANNTDVEKSRGIISDVMLDRLLLSRERINGMAEGISAVAELPDPVGVVMEEHTHKNGMVIKKVSVPIGVVAIIYESRPNVTSDAAALAFKSGNACILRSGKEAWNSANAVVNSLRTALHDCGIPKEFVSLIEDTDRRSANEIMTANEYVDLLIPRGGHGLISACVNNATVPCIQTGTGICHIYVDTDADLEMAVNIVNNAKTSRPSVCNACEVCLVHEEIAGEFLPMLQNAIGNRVELRLDKAAAEYINGKAAGENDFDTEFLDYILAVKIVRDAEEAIAHIGKHSTHHSEAIITENHVTAEKFLNMVDSSSVYWNASTRFTDGGEFGLGCEMGISTQKLHARGPMGLRELTTYKYKIYGNGQIR